jgi:hypothetical protein
MNTARDATHTGSMHSINLTYMLNGTQNTLNDLLTEIIATLTPESLSGHRLLEKIIEKGIDKLLCEIEWKIGTKINKLNFNIIITRELFGEQIIDIFKGYPNIYIYIKNINASNSNNISGKSCLWLISNPNYKITYLGREITNIIYLGYIRSEGKKCFRVLEREDVKVPQGTLIMNILIELSRFLRFNGISLLDYATKKCNVINLKNENEVQDRSLKYTYLLSTGDTYYGKFGFKPIVQANLEIYNKINSLFNKPIVELFHDVDLQSILTKISSEKESRRNPLTKLYLETLMRRISEGSHEPFYMFNARFIKSDCKNEKIILDILEDYPFIKDITTGKFIRSLSVSNFEKMYLPLNETTSQNGGLKYSKNKLSKLKRLHKKTKLKKRH